MAFLSVDLDKARAGSRSARAAGALGVVILLRDEETRHAQSRQSKSFFSTWRRPSQQAQTGTRRDRC